MGTGAQTTCSFHCVIWDVVISNVAPIGLLGWPSQPKLKELMHFRAAHTREMGRGKVAHVSELTGATMPSRDSKHCIYSEKKIK